MALFQKYQETFPATKAVRSKQLQQRTSFQNFLFCGDEEK